MGEKEAPTRAQSDVFPERRKQLDRQWSNNRQGKGYGGKAESRTMGLKWTCCEGTGWSNRSSYPAQSNRSPKANSPAASRTWLWLEHRLAQHTDSCTYTWHSPHAWLTFLQKVNARSRILVEFVKLKQSFYCWTAVLCQCLLTSAKKHPSVREQLGTFKFNDDSKYAKEVITTRKARFFLLTCRRRVWKDREERMRERDTRLQERCTWQTEKHREPCEMEEVVDRVILSGRKLFSCKSSQVQKRNHRRLTTDK